MHIDDDIKVACKDCKHRMRWHSRFCKAETVEHFDPINGSRHMYRRCVEKNQDGDCKDFQPKKPRLRVEE